MAFLWAKVNDKFLEKNFRKKNPHLDPGAHFPDFGTFTKTLKTGNSTRVYHFRRCWHGGNSRIQLSSEGFSLIFGTFGDIEDLVRPFFQLEKLFLEDFLLCVCVCVLLCVCMKVKKSAKSCKFWKILKILKNFENFQNFLKFF